MSVDRIKLNDQLSPIWADAGLSDESHDQALNDLVHTVADAIEAAIEAERAKSGVTR